MCKLPNHLAYIGCYSKLEGGITILEVNPNDGSFRRRGMLRGIADPTWVQLNRDNTMLYAGVCQIRDKATEGGVAMFRIRGDQLEFASFQPSGGSKPCYVALDGDEKAAFAANYSEGTGAYFPLNADGTLQPEARHFVHTGKGPHPTRQEKAHVHCAEVTPDGSILYLVDLGIDTVVAYRYDNGKGDLSRVPEADIKAAPGAGPRHILFARGGELVYVINELASTVVVYRRDGIAYRPEQTLSLLPEGYPAEEAARNTASAIKMTSDGTRLLCSNRGYDSIAVFAVCPETGLLKLLSINPTLGRGPRDFAILPGDQFVLVAHQYTNNLVSFRLNHEDGTMAPVGEQLLVDQGVCVKIGAPLK